MRIQHNLKQEDWLSGNFPGLYMGVAEFKSRVENWLSQMSGFY
jgi:hypothetical protein